MAKRLSAKEVLDQIDSYLSRTPEYPADDVSEVFRAGVRSCSIVIRENLVPQWQAEPDAPGEHHVEGVDRVCDVYRRGLEGRPWWIEYVKRNTVDRASHIVWEPLAGRRVCPIVKRPKESQ